jgi:hypothetical protein
MSRLKIGSQNPFREVLNAMNKNTKNILIVLICVPVLAICAPSLSAYFKPADPQIVRDPVVESRQNLARSKAVLVHLRLDLRPMTAPNQWPDVRRMLEQAEKTLASNEPSIEDGRDLLHDVQLACAIEIDVRRGKAQFMERDMRSVNDAIMRLQKEIAEILPALK